jgi:hypothetical protein
LALALRVPGLGLGLEGPGLGLGIKVLVNITDSNHKSDMPYASELMNTKV